MTARLQSALPARRLTLAVVASLSLLLTAGAVEAQGATTLSAVNLCVKKSNPGKGTIRLI
jgi:hypothetical protein